MTDEEHDDKICSPVVHSHRSWQLDAFKKVEQCNANGSHNTIPVNACVGSGKTNVASYAIGNFIKKNFSKKTIQMFVTPCNLVQGDALDPKSYEEKLQPFNAEAFVVVMKTDDSIELTVVKDRLHMKKITYTDRLKLKDTLNKLVKKKVPIFKI